MRDRPSLESILVQAGGTKNCVCFEKEVEGQNTLNKIENNEEYEADSNQRVSSSKKKNV